VVTCFCSIRPLFMVVAVVSLITVPSGSVLVVVLVLVLLLVELVVTGAGGGGGGGGAAAGVALEEEQPTPRAVAATIAEPIRTLRSFIIKNPLSMKLRGRDHKITDRFCRAKR